MRRGWFGESRRHSLSRMGVKTTVSKDKAINKPAMKWHRYYYRARGKYIGTGRDAYITTVWRTNKEDALADARMFGDRFDDIKIVEIDGVDYANKHKKLPKT